MRQIKLAGVAAAVGVAALAISGCYTFSGITLSKITTRPGTSSTVAVKNMAQVNQSPENRTRYFLLVGLPDNATATTSDDAYNADRASFDTTGVLYRRPKPLPNNTAMRDFLVSEGGCGPFDLDSDSTDRYVTFVSERKVKTAPFRRQVTSAYRLRQARLSEQGTPVPLFTAVGAWADDGDDVPEASSGIGDPGEVACWGGANHTIRPKPEPASPRLSAREAVDLYAR